MSFCPVPVEQQPVNEYQELSQSWFFQWVTLPKTKFFSKLSGVWSLSLLLTAPISSASFPPDEQTFPFLIASALGSGLFVAFVLIRLYLGWKYIGDRLKKTKIVYEESSWYDGQVWEKPLEIYNRDRLIFSYQVEPVLKRLEKSGLLLIALMVSGIILFWLS
ncbi:CGLD27 family protein [Cyanobacterium stanieri LEGE 03274]|uniref:CGLD27 family protein n=1 Tax=Cyanobacterium stanieri LEGE 03274 TaxID=1828756 RepID=A0ABR9V434_9CHRO|nr:CGLD27 family protein [Cyanobacterium stanieri]MBE9222642.1 CGLD27 family protein [Cyanobacterium stanieri LEGE 03274]